MIVTIMMTLKIITDRLFRQVGRHRQKCYKIINAKIRVLRHAEDMIL